MAITCLFSELDRDTREYLLEVRDRKGKRMPGMFAEVSNPWVGIGCICGPILVVVTLLFTLTDWIDIVYDEPNRVAFLQTAGIVLGGWMLVAAVRSRLAAKSAAAAGHWVYADALHLYEAKGDQITFSPMHEMTQVNHTHKYNNDTYQNTEITVKFGKKVKRIFSIANEPKADKFVAFLNYLAFVYGPDGEGRDELPPEALGALARHVAKSDDEPLDEHGKPDLSRIADDYDVNVPQEPERARRAPPNVLPYVGIFVAAVLCYFAMRLVNVPIRDNAIYSAVSQNPIEPRYLRAYLIDSRNTRHRQSVADLLATFYDPVVSNLRSQPVKTDLKSGFADLMHSVRAADQAVVSIRVAEVKSPVGASGSESRVKTLRDEFAKRIANALTPMSRAIVIPADVIIVPPPPPAGEQLLAFVEAPSEAPAAHFDIKYWFQPDENGAYQVVCRMEIRVNIEDRPVATSEFSLPVAYTAGQADAAVTALLTKIVVEMTGTQPGNPQFGGLMPNPGVFIPPPIEP